MAIEIDKETMIRKLSHEVYIKKSMKNEESDIQ